MMYQGLIKIPPTVMSSSFDISTGVFAGSFSLSKRYINLSINPAGDTVLLVDTNPSFFYQYSLSSPGEINTASDTTKTYDYSSDDSFGLSGFFVKPDGTRAYTVGGISQKVIEYSLSTPWDLSTISANQTVLAMPHYNGGLAFNTDGTLLFFVDASTNIVYKFSLSTAWDTSTGTSSGSELVPGLQSSDVLRDLFFTSDGMNLIFILYVNLGVKYEIYQYSMSSPFDISSLSYSGKLLDVTTTTGTSDYGIFMNSDNTKVYLTSLSPRIITQYDLS